MLCRSLTCGTTLAVFLLLLMSTYFLEILKV